MARSSRTLAGLLVLILTALALPAAAQHAPTEPPPPGAKPENVRKAQSIARNTMSPFCPGRTLADCPSQYAAEWRKEIQSMVDQGKTAQEIQAILEDRAGGDLSGSPNRGVGWGLPIGLGFTALIVLYGALRYVRGRKEEEGARPLRRERLSDVENAELEERLRKELEDDVEET